MAQLQAITVDDKARTVTVRMDDGTGEVFSGSLADYANYIKRFSVASNPDIAKYSLLDSKLKVDPNLKDTSDIIAKPIAYTDPVTIKPADVAADPILDEPVGGK